MKITTPVKSIRSYCLGCSCKSAKEVKLCPIDECELYPYRLGKNPKRQGMGNSAAFAKKARAKSVTSLSAYVVNISASVAPTKLNSSTQLMNREEK